MGTPWFMYDITKRYKSYDGKFHDGWDFGAPSHTPVTSLTGGRVTTHTGWKAWGGEVDTKGGILGPTVTETVAHLDRIDVRPGELVYPGEQVGLSGGEGLPRQYSTGPHVHYSLFGAAPWDNQHSIDPSQFLSSVRNFGIGSEGGASGIGPGDIPGAEAIAKAISDSYNAAEQVIGHTVKRIGWFMLGLLLLLIGVFLVITPVIARARKEAYKAASVAAKVL